MISLFTVLLARETADSKHRGTAAAAFIRGGCYHPKPKSDAAEHPRVSMTFIVQVFLRKLHAAPCRPSSRTALCCCRANDFS